MDSEPAKKYFDRPCGSYDEFARLKEELEGQGFEYEGNTTTNGGLYHQQIWMREAGGVGDYRIFKARTEQQFRNRVGERTWDLRDKGYSLVRTQGFNVDGTLMDDLVAFFVKGAA